jgi:hypothetical protein
MNFFLPPKDLWDLKAKLVLPEFELSCWDDQVSSQFLSSPLPMLPSSVFISKQQMKKLIVILNNKKSKTNLFAPVSVASSHADQHLS